MNEVVLIDSKFPKNKASMYSSFDVVFYKEKYYAGFQLFKNFANYLAGTFHFSVIKFDNPLEAEKYFEKVDF